MVRKKRSVLSRSELQPTTSIVVPVLNEAENVLPLVKRIKAAVSSRRIEVLFIDDSKNGLTVQRVREAFKQFGNARFGVHVYHRVGEKNWGGLSGAVADGMNMAKSDKILVMDGDLQHPPELIPEMIDAGKHYDMVIASRYRKGGSASGLSSGVRHFVSRGSTILAKAFFPLRLRKVTDPMTGFFLFDRTKIEAKKLRPQGFKILLEILASHPKLTVTEVPLQFAERNAGESHGDIKQGLKFLNQLINLHANRVIDALSRLPKPILFGGIGGSVFVAGMALLYALIEVFGMSPLAANAIQLAVTFWLNYSLNRSITWRERNVSSLAAHKFIVSRAATTVLNYFMFAWLIAQPFAFTAFGQNLKFSINYLVANVISLAVIMVLNFVISDRWAFAETKGNSFTDKLMKKLPSNIPSFAYLTALLILVVDFGIGFNPGLTFSVIMAVIGIALFIQSSMEVWRTMYAYRDPSSIDRLRFPEAGKPNEHFAIIVPARHESAVLAHTLRQLAKQTHPSVDIIAVICDDDYETLSVAFEVEREVKNVGVIRYPLAPGVKPSKPKQLNYVFEQIKNEGYTVIGVVDAEDSVHEELLVHIDAAFKDKDISIVQGGVQLMNHDTSWYSLHNVLEYYRWFNSTMSFQADSKFMPLGGNTIFVREKLLRKAGGWPETLTEDCSLGVLLSTRFKANTAVYYEPRLATREETPDTLTALFKQRVRWNQGFFHEWQKGLWQDLPSYRQRLMADYVLFSPMLLAAMSVLMPLSLLTFLFLDAPVGLVMIMYMAFIPATLNLVLNSVLLHDFGKAFERKVKVRHYAMLVATQFFYQFVLSAAAFWAVVRELRGDQSWYKTAHSGQHRLEIEPVFASQEPEIAFAQEGSDA